MIDWAKIEEKIKTASVLKTLETHLDPKERRVVKDRVQKVREVHSVYSELLKKIRWSSISTIEESLLQVTFILFLTEGILGFGMNMIIYALMLKEHHDIWWEWKQRFVSSFDELFEVRLSVRLKFLEKHGFEFFSEICPKNIRNATAHLDFNIGSDGTIHLKRGKKYAKKELESVISNIVRLVKLLDENI